MEFDLHNWWIVAIVVAGLVFGGVGMILDHQRKQKALDIVREAVAQGREVSPAVLEGLTRDPNADWTGMGGGRHGGWEGVAFFLIMAGGFGFAAWFYGGRAEGAFWLVAAIMTAMAVMTAISTLLRRK